MCSIPDPTTDHPRGWNDSQTQSQRQVDPSLLDPLTGSVNLFPFCFFFNMFILHTYYVLYLLGFLLLLDIVAVTMSQIK